MRGNARCPPKAPVHSPRFSYNRIAGAASRETAPATQGKFEDFAAFAATVFKQQQVAAQTVRYWFGTWGVAGAGAVPDAGCSVVPDAAGAVAGAAGSVVVAGAVVPDAGAEPPS